MKKLIVLPFVGISCAAMAQISFIGNENKILEQNPPSSSGLNQVYVIRNTAGVKCLYQASDNHLVNAYRFYKDGASHATSIPVTPIDDKQWSFDLEDGDCGYIIEEGSKSLFIWIVDYKVNQIELNSLALNPESDCNTTILDVEGVLNPIYYYSINGQRLELNRDMRVTYLNSVFDDTSFSFMEESVARILTSTSSSIRVPVVLCSTDFTLSGDKFLSEWDEEMSVTSPYYSPKALLAETTATQAQRDNDNEISGNEATLGGSAPAEIDFEACVTEAAVFMEWQLSFSPEFDIIEIRQNTPDFNYSFTKEGNSYVRFIAANDAGECEYVSPVYTITIGESDIKCPNAFSPGASEGINDEWKVSYKSILDFDCHIFNRWGVEVAHFADPSQGWDGTHNGKLVPAGVYFYVIKAVGADGKKYNLKGDINIIKYKQNNLNNLD